MSEYVYETIETEHVIAKMILDEDAPNPRVDHDNAGRILGWARNYRLGDEDLDYRDIDDIRLTVLNYADVPLVCRHCGEPITGEYMDVGNFAHEEDWNRVDDLDDLTPDDLLCNRNPIEPDTSKLVMFGLDHFEYNGSLSIVELDDTTDWSDTYRIDGIIFATQQTVMYEWGSSDDPIEMAENYLRGEITEYSEYLQGNVWGVVVESKHTGEELDACWGYVGTDYAESVLKEEAEAYTKIIADELATEEAAAHVPVLLST